MQTKAVNDIIELKEYFEKNYVLKSTCELNTI